MLQQGKWFEAIVWYLYTGPRGYIPQRRLFDEDVTVILADAAFYPTL